MSTHVVRSHISLERREELSEIGSEGARERANEIARGTDEGGIVFRLLSGRNGSIVFVIVDLARSLSLEDERNLLADRLNVCSGEIVRSQIDRSVPESNDQASKGCETHIRGRQEQDRRS